MRGRIDRIVWALASATPITVACSPEAQSNEARIRAIRCPAHARGFV